jgi:hypothetical protein
MEAANAVVPKITPAQARDMIVKDNTLVVDVRDGPELEKSGKVAGAVHHSRGMLEFRADPESSYYDRNFSHEKIILTLALIAFHLVGVVLTSIVHRENLVLAMITGRKRRDLNVDRIQRKTV